MKDYDIQKKTMLANHLKGRGITDEKILKAFEAIPRENFLLPENQKEAYGDYPLPIGEGQTTSQPYIIAKMIELLNIKKNDNVLEIGTGSGYQTAILAYLSQKVFSIERIEKLFLNAKINLEKLHFNNIYLKLGDGTIGWKDFAPYDKIIVSAAAPEIPLSLLEQLDSNGLLIIPVGNRFTQVLTVVKKSEKGYTYIKDEKCIFVPLIGKEGWKK